MNSVPSSDTADVIHYEVTLLKNQLDYFFSSPDNLGQGQQERILRMLIQDIFDQYPTKGYEEEVWPQQNTERLAVTDEAFAMYQCRVRNRPLDKYRAQRLYS